MSELRYPNEDRAYREARDALLKDEQALVELTKAVAAERRKLPPGGELKQDYVFEWASDGKVGESMRFSDLFGDKDTLLIYSWMFGPNWDKPCLSCTSLIDGFDRSWYQVTRDAAFVAIAKAPAARIHAWAKGARLVEDGARLGFEITVPGRLQMPRRKRRHAMAGDACLQQAGRKNPALLGDGGRIEPRRYGVALLEPDGLHAGRPARP